MFFPCSRLPSLTLTLVLVAPGLLCAGQTVARSQSQSSPVGRWTTIDDASGKAKSIVAIREDNGKLYGTIETLLNPPEPNPTCKSCSGDLKDRPVVGLQILWDFQPDGNQWSGGEVLDPETGKVYKATLALENGGKALRLHGYIGIPLFGRTEHWARAD